MHAFAAERGRPAPLEAPPAAAATGAEPVVLPPVLAWGRWLFALFLAAVVVCGEAYRTLFPRQAANGLDATSLAILIPIGCVGLAGVLLLLAGWIQYPRLYKQLDPYYERRPDGRVLAPWVKRLGSIFIGIVWLGTASALWSHGEILGFYLANGWLGFIYYLGAGYTRRRHPATTTYLNLFTPFFAVLLVPLTWPLLVLFNLRSGEAERPWPDSENEAGARGGDGRP